MSPPISVLGAGSWGTALAMLLAKNTQAVQLWGQDKEQIQAMQHSRCNEKYLPQIRFPDNLQLTADLATAITTAEDLLIVVPSYAFHDLLHSIKPFCSPQHRLVWGTKGFAKNSQPLLHDQVQEILGDVITAALSGPSFAKEVALEKPTAAVIATTYPAFGQALSSRFSNQYFRIYTTTDLIGVEVCGAVKNVLAIAAGVIDALDLGSNALSAFITRGLAEMQRLGIALGGIPSTFMGLAGLGDLVLTCTDYQSRNRRFGAALALGKTREQALAAIGQVVEGLENLKAVYQLAQEKGVEMPIIQQIYQVIYHDLPVQTAIQNLFSRQLRSEFE